MGITVVTIENHYGNMRQHEGAMPDSRLEWVAGNQFEIRLKGAFKPLDYDAARNLALQYIIGRNLPAIALKRVSRAKRPDNRSLSETKKMF